MIYFVPLLLGLALGFAFKAGPLWLTAWRDRKNWHWVPEYRSTWIDARGMECFEHRFAHWEHVDPSHGAL